MKNIFIFAAAAMIFSFLGCGMQSETATAQTKQGPSNKATETKSKPAVLVELFTSQGCSSCPPADRVLAQLEKERASSEAEIVTLSLHVDYWNRLGWKDEFSQKAFSERQNGYAERFKMDAVYTPQMVVDGETQFVGSNLDTARKAIADAAKTKKAAIEITNANDKLTVKISDAPPHEDAYVWLAVAEDDLQTDVRRGENAGEKLTHISVVRELKLLGTLAASDKTFAAESPLQFDAAWKKANLKFVVFVQGKDTKRIFGASRLDN